MNKRAILLLLIALLVVLTPLGARGTAEVKPKTKPLIALSILPHQYFVEAIAQDLVDSFVLVGEGQNPHSYEPTPRQMSALSQADLWLLSGTDFEARLVSKVKALYPALPLVDGTAGFSWRLLSEDEHHEHEGEEAIDHDSPLLDRHSWLGRENAQIFASHLLRELITLLPEDEDFFVRNYQNLMQQIDDLYTRLSRSLEPLKGATIFVYHPSFGYFLDDFGLVQKAVEMGGKEPNPKALSLLIAEAQRERPRAIFVQAQFPAAAARTVAEAVGAKMIALDPLAANWLENIEAIGNSLQEVLP